MENLNFLADSVPSEWITGLQRFQNSTIASVSNFINLLNSEFEDALPIEVMLFTMLLTGSVFYVFGFHKYICGERQPRSVWKSLRQLPLIKQIVAKRMSKSAEDIETQLQKGLEDKIFLQKLPEDGWVPDDILQEVNKYLDFGKFSWSKGYVSGTVYHGNDKKLKKLMTDVYDLTAYTNPLHPDVFPGIRIMEAEIIHMLATLFGDPKAVGTVTSGGTESIFLACKAYRDYAVNEKGILKPNMVIPVTAHAAFDKAAHILKIKVKHIPVDPKTTKVSIWKMWTAIDKNTCMLVGSAPAFPHGSIDPIEKIAKLGVKHNIPVHVDACLGGFLVSFLEKAGYETEKFNFALKGVTSISADTHKYAYAPKGSSVILYKDKAYRHYQYSVQPDWPGGIYGTPNLSGSRSGGVIATCWASLLYHGEETYIKFTRQIISTTRYIEHGLRDIPHIHIIGQPEVSVLAIGSKAFDIYRLSSALSDRGWNLNVLQFPPGFHLCVTLQHTYEGVADQFLSDVRESVIEIMKTPHLPTKGTAAIYGMSQQIPDRSLVSELVWTYLDLCYDNK